MKVLFLFSLFDPDNELPGVGAMSPATRERLILLGALVLLVALLVVLTVIVRQGKKRHRRHAHSHRPHFFRRTANSVAELKQMIPEKPRRRRRRDHRPRNPTLAETGGLPPVRSDEPLDPPQARTQPR